MSLGHIMDGYAEPLEIFVAQQQTRMILLQRRQRVDNKRRSLLLRRSRVLSYGWPCGKQR
jgi:hypothetical protein